MKKKKLKKSRPNYKSTSYPKKFVYNNVISDFLCFDSCGLVRITV